MSAAATMGYISQITEKWLQISKHLTHVSIDAQESVYSEMMI